MGSCPTEEEYVTRHLEVLGDILEGLDEDIKAKYIKRVRVEPEHNIGWQTWEPWLEQLCRHIKKLTSVRLGGGDETTEIQ